MKKFIKCTFKIFLYILGGIIALPFAIAFGALWALWKLLVFIFGGMAFLFGVLVLPFAWIVNCKTRKQKLVLKLIETDGLRSVDDIAEKANLTAEDVQKAIDKLIDKNHLYATVSNGSIEIIAR